MPSIRFKTTLLICGFVFVVIAACATAAYQEMKDSAVLAARARLINISEELAANLAASAQGLKLEVATVAANRTIVGYLQDPGAPAGPAMAVLRSGDRQQSGGREALLGTELRDRTGRRALHTEDVLPRPAGSFESDLARVVRDADSVTIAPFRASGDTLLYAVLGPVRAEGETIGHVLRWRRLLTSAESLELIGDLIGSDGRVYLANTRGDLWTDLNRPVPPRPVDLEQLAGAMAYQRPEGGEALAAGAAVAGSPWTVLVEFPLDQVLVGPREVIREMALFGTVLLLAGAVIAWFLSGRMTASIVELSEVAEAISRGDHSRRTTVGGADEIGTLGVAFNAMADRVAAARADLEQKIEQLAARETEHRETRESLEHVIASSRAILYKLRIRGGEATLDWISENLERDLGYEVEEALQHGWWHRALHPDDRETLPTVDRLLVDGGRTREYRLRHADGQYRWMRDEQRVISDRFGEANEIVGVLSDITEHRRLAIAKEAAEAANLAKNEFLSRMSHELRTPLNAILGFGQLLELEVETEENQESAAQILRAGKHLLALIDEVLDIARIEAGQMSLSVEPVTVHAVLQESVELVRFIASKQGITIEAHDALASKHIIQADQQRLKQVLLNLLSNAIKYNRREGKVTLSCEPIRDDRLRLVVQDTGYGLPPEKLERLFTPFDRLGADRTAVEGTGLGLALSRGLVNAMGGTMGVESVEGEGSRFWVDLPRAPRQIIDEPVLEERQSDIPGDAAAATHTVLFVEDNLANVRLMERILRRRPHVRLVTAMQGGLGLEIAREHHPDLILLDLNLPDLSGDQVLLQLRQDPALRDIPVVMISGDAIPSQVQRMLGMGAQCYITKPFDVHEILSVVDQSLG